MKERAMRLSYLTLSVAIVTGCTTQIPTGPSVAVMPAQGKPFEVFQQDNAICTQYAGSQIGKGPQQAGQSEVAAGAVTGAVIGAAAGAALGDSSRAAGAGAGAGLLMGTAVGANNGERSTGELQRRYDIAYEQCMYSKGNQLPNQRSPYRGASTYRYRAAPMPPPPY